MKEDTDDSANLSETLHQDDTYIYKQSGIHTKQIEIVNYYFISLKVWDLTDLMIIQKVRICCSYLSLLPFVQGPKLENNFPIGINDG